MVHYSNCNVCFVQPFETRPKFLNIRNPQVKEKCFIFANSQLASANCTKLIVAFISVVTAIMNIHNDHRI